jgi:sarcosine oxidase gamma subunit
MTPNPKENNMSGETSEHLAVRGIDESSFLLELSGKLAAAMMGSTGAADLSEKFIIGRSWSVALGLLKQAHEHRDDEETI